VVHRAEVAAAELERQGVSVEIIDLRSLSPFDWDAIAATVRKTNRAIVAYEDTLSWGYGPKSPRASATNFSITWTPRCGALRRWTPSAPIIPISKMRFFHRLPIW